MADADSVLEAAEFASVFPENAGILSPLLWFPVLVVSHIGAMGRLFGLEYSLVPLVGCQFPRVVQFPVRTRHHRILVWWC
jgi:hypothetical protein